MELDVFFEDPFWIGVFYLNGDCERFVERVVFGNEPKDGEVYNYIYITVKIYLLKRFVS